MPAPALQGLLSLVEAVGVDKRGGQEDVGAVAHHLPRRAGLGPGYVGPGQPLGLARAALEQRHHAQHVQGDAGGRVGPQLVGAGQGLPGHPHRPGEVTGEQPCPGRLGLQLDPGVGGQLGAGQRLLAVLVGLGGAALASSASINPSCKRLPISWL